MYYVRFAILFTDARLIHGLHCEDNQSATQPTAHVSQLDYQKETLCRAARNIFRDVDVAVQRGVVSY